MSATGTRGGSVRPCVSVPRALLDAYDLAGTAVPPLSTLLQRAMASALATVGADVPASPQPAQTAAATAARAHRRRAGLNSRGR